MNFGERSGRIRTRELAGSIVDQQPQKEETVVFVLLYVKSARLAPASREMNSQSLVELVASLDILAQQTGQPDAQNFLCFGDDILDYVVDAFDRVDQAGVLAEG